LVARYRFKVKSSIAVGQIVGKIVNVMTDDVDVAGEKSTFALNGHVIYTTVQ